MVSKTSTGAVEHIPIARVTNLSQTLDKLKEEGFWIFGTDMNGTPSHQWNTAGKLALIIGNEGKGLSLIHIFTPSTVLVTHLLIEQSTSCLLYTSTLGDN